MIKVGIIIPDRGDRPAFLRNCLRMVNNQTHKPYFVHVVDYTPLNSECDITPRYRSGYELLSKIDSIDVIAFIENDDWYSPDYLEIMVKEWDKSGRPDIFGTNYTIYYNIKLRKYYTMHHMERASAMNTLIKPRLKLLANRSGWPVDSEPFTDAWLWTRLGLSKVTFKPDKHISIGIKHGVGKCGGRSHIDQLHRYDPPRGSLDNGFLKETMDEQSFAFYSRYSQPVIQNNSDFLPSIVDE
jgi:glycosyltransferase involved in cell wall biosynthesis